MLYEGMATPEQRREFASSNGTCAGVIGKSPWAALMGHYGGNVVNEFPWHLVVCPTPKATLLVEQEIESY